MDQLDLMLERPVITGQVPGWVREWQAKGGDLAALKAVL